MFTSISNVFIVIIFVAIMISTSTAQDPDRKKYFVGLNGDCVGDEFFTNVQPDGVTKFWCEYGLRCVYDTIQYLPVATTNDVGVCQPIFRKKGYPTCALRDNVQPLANSVCRNAQCCGAGLFCPPLGSPNAGVCDSERGDGGVCIYGNNALECKRGYLCNADQSVPLQSNTAGVCTRMQSVGRNEQATDSRLCESGLILLTGTGTNAVSICVKPEDVSCTSAFNDQQCGYSTFRANFAQNAIDSWLLSSTMQGYGQLWQINKAYTCNERSQCQVTNSDCSKWMERLLLKNAGGERNELGLETFTSTRYEECKLFQCVTGKQGVATSESDSDIYQCSDESMPSAQKSDATSAQLAGAVFGTAIVTTVIGCVLWKYNGGSFSLPGRG